MRVLVTGSAGLVGSRVCLDLRQRGDEVVEYDRADSHDILDAEALDAAMRGCAAVVHCAALLGEPGQADDDILAVNLRGTENVVRSAERARARRLVFVSSVDVLGVFKGERPPDYLPLDDDHPCHAATVYGVAKLRAEALCRSRASSELSIVCLRPPGVWTGPTYEWVEAERHKRTEFEWDPFWEYGAFIDVRDLSAVCLRALDAPVDAFESLLVSAADVTTSGRTSRQLVEFIHPQVEWRGGPEFEREPYRSLIDIDRARAVLGWEPEFSWARFRANRDGSG
ncbi:MAG: NAD(P)-dependent oxidoreductase [Deltaproteobacteria bacterium]|nr:NAD(P)-dependent oxidoreductase [Deltaproteobacteria bacterium]